jgi:hypothetical protein
MNKLLKGINNTEINLDKSKLEINNSNQKFNPDVNQKYSNILNKRSVINYQYSNQMWKPIIGSISKSDINLDDLKIKIDTINSAEIKSKYESELENRLKEKILADKLAEDHSNKNNSLDITKPIELKLDELKNIDNSFIELKNSAKNIISNSNDIDTSVIMDSIHNLDELMNSIKNL